ncbi:hypothetical protein [Hyphomicrobium sp. ghe19]|uniref:hypothetical protein n=1 Tax=Hyphomicrobium sp. ghe19 TaxID=2682968 RepID=UPI001366CE67|nr:hypothetical protein HYPP_02386 [Hyphomicrobium sp. ghe19]
MSHLKLVEPPALTPEDHRQRYRDAHGGSEKRHHYRVTEAERLYASEVLRANTERKVAIENAPKIYGSSDSSNGTFQCGDDVAIEAAEAAFRRAHAVADKKRIRAIERSREICGNEINAAKLAFRNSPGWLGYFP